MQIRVMGFDKSGGLPILADHLFTTSDDGQLVHIVDGRLRATVPPEGWADYLREWPEAGGVVDSLRIVPAAVVQVAQEQTHAEKIAAMESALAALKAEDAVAS